MALFSCDDKDSEPPLINIVTPQENASFSVFDTIAVTYQASDDRVVESVSIKLVNLDFIPVSAPVTQHIGKAEHTGGAELVIDDRQLESGNYYVLVTATDGANDRNAYLRVHVAAYPFERRAMFFSDMNTVGQGSIYRVDSLFSGIALHATPGQDIGRLLVSSASDRLTVAGSQSTGIIQYDLEGNTQKWSASAINQPPAPTFLDMVAHGTGLFISLFTRELRGYSLDGALILNRQFEHDRPHTLYADEQHVLVNLREIGGGQSRLLVLRQDNFSEKWSVALPMEIVAFCRHSSTEVFIFGNDQGQARVLLYDTGTNGWWEPRQLPPGRILHAVKGEGQTSFLALESGLYAYTYSPNYLNTLRAGEVFQRLCFDRADALLIGAMGNSLKVIAPQQGTVVAALNHTDSITDLDIRYTK